jgi:hypothetical protein
MTAATQGEQLIQELFADPKRFAEVGRSHDLLQAYFDGLAVDTLRPLLRSADVWIQRVGGFVASELGAKAQALVHDVLPLLNSPEPLVQNYAMEVLCVCSDDETFANIATRLESPHRGLRLQAMSLLANSKVSQLQTAAGVFKTDGREVHARGLEVLAGDPPADVAVRQDLRHPDALIRRYAAIAAKRFGLKGAQDEATRNSNADVRDFLTGS